MSIYACDCGATDCRSCGPKQGYNPCEHNHMPGLCPYKDCPNCPDFIGCISCDKSAEARCHGCGEHLCAKCLPMCGGEPGLCACCLKEMKEPNADVNTDLRGEEGERRGSANRRSSAECS